MTGQYFHNIDAKGRLFIPAKLREQLGDTLHVTVGQDGCLSVYSDTEWEKFQQKLDERNFTDVKKLRLMFAYMADCEPDAQGRILIPNHLRQRAKLEKEVVVQGNPRVYKALRDQLAAVLDELRRIEAGQSVNDELLDTIRMITTIMNGMQEDFAYDR